MSKESIYLMSFVLVLAVTGAASADQQIITVPDASFEDHALNNPGGYVYIGSAGYTGAWKSDIGEAYVDYGYWRSQGDIEDLQGRSGELKAYPSDADLFDYIYQILDETFIEGATYTLSVWVGNAWPAQGYADGWGLYFTGENYKINLAEAHGLALLGDWEQISLEYTATADDAGKKIGIKMSGEEGESYIAFDDVTLSYSNPVLAADPNPANEQKDVPRDVILSWTPGAFVGTLSPTHKVFFSENFDDVNNGVGGITQSASSYDLGRLEFGTTYYWRIDEVYPPPESTVYPSGVWSFTTELLAYPIDGANIIPTASSIFGNSGPEKTIDGSGLNDSDLHSTNLDDMWLSGSTEPQSTWIEYQFDKVYKLHEMWVWNQNQLVESAVGYGFKDVTIEHSVDGVDYTTLGTTHEFARAPVPAGYYAHNTTLDLSGVTAKYVRLTANSNWGGIVAQYGLSEVRFLYIPVRAREPQPDSGATGVDVDVVLDWRAGREAASHNVSFSADEQAVMDGTAPVTTVANASYTPPALDLASTYYWRVEEVNEAETPTTWQGDVWGFTTQEFIVVDDFESYNDIEAGQEGSNLIYETWLDGFDNPSANGSTMGYTEMFQPTMESDIVHGGQQSAPMGYNNTAAALSEVTRTLAPQDWTKHSVQTLTLWFRGAAGNTGQLYVKVNGSKVVYDGDAADMRRAWQAWNIELASFGANLQSVTSLAIGVEGFGATGTLLLDDIRLYSYGRQLITPTEPDPTGLIGHWKLDGDTLDSSGLGNHGTANGGPTYAAGKVGQAMSFDGTDDYVVIDGVADDITSSDITLAAWVNMTSDTDWYPIISCNTAAGGNVGWLAVDSGYADFDPFTGTMYVTDNDWHHLAYTRIADTGSLYVDGVLERTDTPGFNFSADNRWSIGQEWDGGPTASDFFIGTVDDARIYDYGLSYGEIGWLAGRTLPFDKPF